MLYKDIDMYTCIPYFGRLYMVHPQTKALVYFLYIQDLNLICHKENILFIYMCIHFTMFDEYIFVFLHYNHIFYIQLISIK